jgi:hypothetical protein
MRFLKSKEKNIFFLKKFLAAASGIYYIVYRRRGLQLRRAVVFSLLRSFSLAVPFLCSTFSLAVPFLLQYLFSLQLPYRLFAFKYVLLKLSNLTKKGGVNP